MADHGAELRRLALAKLASEPTVDSSELTRALHEVSVYQVELELQNANLVEAQAAAELSQRRYYELFENAPVGVVELDGAGRVVSENAAARALLGDVGGRAGMALSLFLTPASREVLARELHATGERPRFDLTLTSGGRSRTCEAQLTRSSAERLLLSLFDVTAAREAERQAALARDQHHLESLGRLAGGVAHDINNVLTTVVLLTSALLDELGEDSAPADDLRSVLSAARRGGQLTAGLLRFARGESGQPTTLSLRKLLDEVCDIVRRSAPKNISVETALGAEAIWVRGDAGPLGQVVVNLLTNSIDAIGDASGIVRVTLRSRGNFAEVVVEDDGPGMDEATRTRALDPFFTTKRPGEGTGLGLSIAHGIMRSHGGDLKLESTLGGGTRVFLKLPQVPSLGQVAAPAPTVDPRARALLAGQLVMVVDDEAPVLRSLVRAVERLGARAVEASSGARALEVFDREREVAACVVDVRMPGMDGWTLAALLRSRRPRLPIVMVSGDAPRNGEQALSGVTFMRKPVGIEELGAALAGAMALEGA